VCVSFSLSLDLAFSITVELHSLSRAHTFISCPAHHHRHHHIHYNNRIINNNPFSFIRPLNSPFHIRCLQSFFAFFFLRFFFLSLSLSCSLSVPLCARIGSDAHAQQALDGHSTRALFAYAIETETAASPFDDTLMGQGAPIWHYSGHVRTHTRIHAYSHAHMHIHTHTHLFTHAPTRVQNASDPACGCVVAGSDTCRVIDTTALCWFASCLELL
jgi:hypothetical protein